MDILYLSQEHGDTKEIDTTTSPETVEINTLSNTMHWTIVSNDTELVSLPEQKPQSSYIYLTVSIILGILLGIVLVALLALTIRNGSLKRKLQAENLNSQNPTAISVIAGESGEQNPYDFANEEVAGTSNNAFANVADAVYSVVNKQSKKSAMPQ
uniref:uncharacterized protein LOC120331668 n=1 Tax=Styela clava TaxID=7725 RepID=UPI00193A9374|nr:uncharacterized protein LOC120331668 [Styela clava]